MITMPLFFASNALYPVKVMPGWLQGLSAANPMSYEVDALRALMPLGGVSGFGLATDFGVLAAVTVAAPNRVPQGPALAGKANPA